MNGIAVFGIEVVASLVISAVILIQLQDLLRRVGAEACGRPGSSEFWTTYARLMMFIGPLLLIAFFSHAGGAPVLSDAAQIKNSLLVVLSGQFISLAVVGRAVWKSVFTPPATPAPATPAAPAVRATPSTGDTGRPPFPHGGES